MDRDHVVCKYGTLKLTLATLFLLLFLLLLFPLLLLLPLWLLKKAYTQADLTDMVACEQALKLLPGQHVARRLE